MLKKQSPDLIFIRDYSKLDHVENTQDFNERAFNYEVLQVIVK